MRKIHQRPSQKRTGIPLILSVAVLLSVAFPFAGARDCQGQPPAPGGAQDQTIREIIQLEDEGLKAFEAHDHATALAKLRAGLEKVKALNDMLGVATFLHNIANVYTDLGELDKARETHTEALTLRQKYKAPAPEIAASLYGLGQIAQMEGRYDQAGNYYLRALLLLKQAYETGDKSPDRIKFLADRMATIFSGLGSLSASLGQHDKALYYYQNVLKIADAMEESDRQFRMAIAIGGVYQAQGKTREALDQYEQATKRLDLSDKPLYAGVLTMRVADCTYALALDAADLAEQWQALGKEKDATEMRQKAKSLCEQALKGFLAALPALEKARNPELIADCQKSIGSVYNFLGKFDQAREYHQKALTIAEQLGDTQQIITNLINIGNDYASEKNYETALKYYLRARDKFEGVEQQIYQADALASLRATESDLYPYIVKVYLQMGRTKDALLAQERGRMRGLAKQAGQNRALDNLLAPEDQAQLRKYEGELSVASRRLRTAVEQGAPADRIRTLEAERDSAHKRLTFQRDTLFSQPKYATYRRVQGADPPTLEQLTTLSRQNPDTLYLEYLNGTPCVHVLAFLNGKLYDLCNLSDSHDAVVFVKRWRKMLEVGGRGVEPSDLTDDEPLTEEQLAAQAYQILLKGVEKEGLLDKARRLVIVGEGPVANTPFAALRDEKGRRLIERLPVASAFSLGSLLWPQTPRKPSGSLLCAIDPTGSDGAKVTSPLRGDFGPLPGARVEGRELVKQYPGAIGFQGPEATETALRREMGRFSLLHFATHAVANSQEGLRSFLVLRPDEAEDGFLEAREIAGMTLAARLVVLSACETGQGQESMGDGLLGLAWAFQAAGCPAIVASQWRVDDEATRTLMLAFYDGLRAGLRKDDALQAAMLQVKKVKPSPKFWAAFQVIGDTGSIGPALAR